MIDLGIAGGKVVDMVKEFRVNKFLRDLSDHCSIKVVMSGVERLHDLPENGDADLVQVSKTCFDWNEISKREVTRELATKMPRQVKAHPQHT